jgi:hypothetical protein
MTQPNQDLTGELAQNSTPPIFDWEHPNGDRAPVQRTITGSGFGSGPTVAIFADWMSEEEGQTAALDSPLIGSFDSGSYATGILPKYVSAFGKTGISMRQGGTNANTDNRLTGFVKQMTPFKNFYMSFEACVPSGRFFPGASSPLTMPAMSSCKPAWLSDGGLDSPTKADVVLGSWIGSNFNFLGNTCPFNIYMASSFDFDGWNSFHGCAIAGTPDAFSNLATIFSSLTNQFGSVLDSLTTQPAFGSGATAAQYTHVNFPAWAGNGSQDLAQLIFSTFYLAVGADDSVRARLELTDSATYSGARIRRAMACDSWADGEITYTPSSKMLEGVTHWWVTTASGTQFSGEI